MSSPYTSPEHQGASGYSVFAVEQARQLQIITGMMIVGVLAATGIMLAMNGAELKNEPELMSWIGIGMAVMMTINHLIIPNVIASVALKKVSAEQVRGTDAAGKFALLAPVFRQRHITSIAILEGAAFLNLIFYMLTSFVGNLVAACVLLLLILVRFPTASRIDFWVQDRIRELEAT